MTARSARSHHPAFFDQDLIRRAFDLAPVGLAVCEPGGRFLVVNDALCKMLGVKRASLVARPWGRYIAFESSDGAGSGELTCSATGRRPQRARLIRRDGRRQCVQAAAERIHRAGGLAELVLITISTIEGREIRDDARRRNPDRRDAITGLPDRETLEHRLRGLLASAAQRGAQVGVLSIGLDRFHSVNDSLGRVVGDSVLQHVARLLNGAVAAGSIVARTGVDHFVVALPWLDCAQVGAQAADICARLSESAVIEDHLVRTPASIGIAMFPQDGENAADLLASADAALHDATARDRHACRFFTMHMKHVALKRVTLEARLRRAIEQQELELHYQPKISMVANQLSGAEALLRWRCPDRGFISPADFIPIAEESGLIVSLGEWVLEESLRQLAQWRDEHALDLTLAVNVSPAQLVGKNSISWITEALERHALPARLLEVEMTESAVIQKLDTVIVGLRDLAQMGVKLAVDDFGTGYSNLSQLGRLPISTIKVDRSLIASITSQPKDAAIVRAVIELAHALRARVVAEGVETCEQAAVLRMARCDFVQGYLFARPMPADEFLRWASARLPKAPSLSGGTGL